MKHPNEILTLALPNNMSYSTTIAEAEQYIIKAMKEYAQQLESTNKVTDGEMRNMAYKYIQDYLTSDYHTQMREAYFNGLKEMRHVLTSTQEKHPESSQLDNKKQVEDWDEVFRKADKFAMDNGDNTPLESYLKQHYSLPIVDEKKFDNLICINCGEMYSDKTDTALACCPDSKYVTPKELWKKAFLSLPIVDIGETTEQTNK